MTTLPDIEKFHEFVRAIDIKIQSHACRTDLVNQIGSIYAAVPSYEEPVMEITMPYTSMDTILKTKTQAELYAEQQQERIDFLAEVRHDDQLQEMLSQIMVYCKLKDIPHTLIQTLYHEGTQNENDTQ